MKCLRVFERDLRVYGQIKHRRAAAGDEKEDQRIFFCFLEKRERGTCCRERVFIRQRVAAFKIANAPVALFGNVYATADTPQTLAALHAVEKDIEHGNGGLAQ